MSQHRLHDFVELGKAIFAGIGEDPQRFVGLMDEMRRQTGTEIAEGDDFIIAVRKALRGLLDGATAGDKLPGWNSWFSVGFVAVSTGDGGAIVGIKPTALVLRLVQPIGIGGGAGADWLPKNPRDLAGALLRTAPLWIDLGIRVEKRKPSKDHTYWEFQLSTEAVKSLRVGS